MLSCSCTPIFALLVVRQGFFEQLTALIGRTATVKTSADGLLESARRISHRAGLGHRVERQRASRRGRVVGALIALIGMVWANPPPPSTALIAVALDSNDAIGPLAWPPPPLESRDPYPVEEGLNMRAVVAMPSGDQHQKRVPLPVAGDVEHGRQPSATAPERRVFRVEGPLFTSAALGQRHPVGVLMRPRTRTHTNLPHDRTHGIRFCLYMCEDVFNSRSQSSLPTLRPSALRQHSTNTCVHFQARA